MSAPGPTRLYARGRGHDTNTHSREEMYRISNYYYKKDSTAGIYAYVFRKKRDKERNKEKENKKRDFLIFL